jgi:arylformamidase
MLDVSRPIDEKTAVWPGDVRFRWRPTARLVEGSLFESTCFTMSAHVGTHVDAPSHVLPNGDPIGRVPLDAFYGPACVVDLPGRGEISAEALPRGTFAAPRVLFRTGGKSFLSPLAAIRLAEKGVILVGTDAMSVDPGDAMDLPVHRTLLSRGVAVLENLDLTKAVAGEYHLVALPIFFRELDASPVRAILIRK